MNLYAFIVIVFILFGGLAYLRLPGKGGKLGQAIRSSDHWAWQEAIKDKEEEIESLNEKLLSNKFSKPAGSIFIGHILLDLETAQEELEFLKAAEPKL